MRLALLLVGLVAAAPSGHAEREGPGPKPTNAPEPLFVPAGAVAPRLAIVGWLRAHPGAVVRVPLTVWPGSTGGLSGAALGIATQPDARFEVDDGRLGLSLADRARAACGRARCTLWVVGTWRDFEAPQPTALDSQLRSGTSGCGVRSADAALSWGRLTVTAVGPRLSTDRPPPPSARFEVERGPSCLALRVQTAVHCARGPGRCRSCAKAARSPAQPTLLDLCPDGPAARPTLEVMKDGVRARVPWEAIRTFGSVDEARAFAAAHRITDVVLP